MWSQEKRLQINEIAIKLSGYIEAGNILCGSLKVIGPLNLIGNGIVRRCGVVGVGIVLLKEVYHFEGGL